MTQDLAKQLKDAGFPQDIKEGEIRWTKGFENTKNPNLSELIEACEDRFDVLSKLDIYWAVFLAFSFLHM